MKPFKEGEIRARLVLWGKADRIQSLCGMDYSLVMGVLSFISGVCVAIFLAASKFDLFAFASIVFVISSIVFMESCIGMFGFKDGEVTVTFTDYVDVNMTTGNAWEKTQVKVVTKEGKSYKFLLSGELKGFIVNLIKDFRVVEFDSADYMLSEIYKAGAQSCSNK